MNCKSCGAVLKAGAKFCGQCGAVETSAAAVVEPGSAEQTIRCPQCGAESPGSAKFCRVDGYRFPVATETPGASVQGSSSIPVPAMNPPSPPQATGLRCPRCGTANPPGARFCRKDGAALSAVASAPADGIPAVAPKPARTSITPPVPPDQLPPARSPRSPSVAPEPAGATARPPRNWRPAMIGGGVLGLLLLTVGAGYAYWTGLIGDRPGSIAREVTAELKEEGFSNVTVIVGKDWIAHVSGSVVGQDKKQALEATLVGRSEIVGTNFDALEVRPSHDEIHAEIAKALAANRLGHITAEVDDHGSVILTGRAEREHEIEHASDIVMSVPGVSAVDPRISLPFSVVEREINQALRESGFTGVRIGVRSIDDISVSGILREDQDRAAVIAKVVEIAATFGETINPSAIRDETTIEASVFESPLADASRSKELTDSAATKSVASIARTTPTKDPIIPVSRFARTWSGTVRQGSRRYPINLVLRPGDNGVIHGDVSYPSLKCSGSWSLTGFDNNSALFAQTITNKARCIDTQIAMRITDSGAELKWRNGCCEGSLTAVSPGAATTPVATPVAKTLSLSDELTALLQKAVSVPQQPDKNYSDGKLGIAFSYPSEYELVTQKRPTIALLFAPSQGQTDPARTHIAVTMSSPLARMLSPTLDEAVNATLKGTRATLAEAEVAGPMPTKIGDADAQVFLVIGKEGGLLMKKAVTIAVVNKNVLGVVLHATPETFEGVWDAYRRVSSSYTLR